MATLEHAFGVRNLMMLASAFSQDPQNQLQVTQLFMAGERRSTMSGEFIEWDRQDDQRELAPVGSDCAPSIRVYPNDREHNKLPLINIRIHERIKLKKIAVNERAPGRLVPDAEDQIARRVRNIVKRTNSDINHHGRCHRIRSRHNFSQWS